jgi:hypothetical protein
MPQTLAVLPKGESPDAAGRRKRRGTVAPAAAAALARLILRGGLAGLTAPTARALAQWLTQQREVHTHLSSSFFFISFIFFFFLFWNSEGLFF